MCHRRDKLGQTREGWLAGRHVCDQVTCNQKSATWDVGHSVSAERDSSG